MKKLKVLLLLVAALAVVSLLAATFPPGYVGGRIYTGECLVPTAGTVVTLAVPGGVAAQSGSLIVGSSLHTATAPVYITYGDTAAPADPTIAVPTAGNPTGVDYLDPGQSADIPAGIRYIKLKTTADAYVRWRIIY